MVTKWKKWNKNGACAVAAYVLGISLLLSGGIGIWSKASFAEFGTEDFQETAGFRDFISYRLEDFLDMACNEYVGGYAYGDIYTTDVVEQAVEEAIGGTYLQQEMTVIDDSESDWEEDLEDWEEKAESGNFSKKEREKMAQRFNESLQKDKNLLYAISSDGGAMYYNTEGKDDLEKYNFYLHFDGEKVSIKKDGKELDIYGDGIYREDDDWRLPGYHNLTGKENWKRARVDMWVAREPVIYSDSLYGDGYGWRSDTLYYLYKNHMEARWQFKVYMACVCSGILLLALYLFMRKENGEASRVLARVTGKLWFECKVLLFLFLPLLFWTETFQSINTAYLGYDNAYIYENTAEYLNELSAIAGSGIFNNLAWLLPAFWLFYLFFNDLFRNKGSYKNGGFGKLATVFAGREAGLPLSKKLIRRSYGIFFVTLAQFVVFFFLLVFVFVFNYRFAGGGAQEGGICCLIALAFSILMLVAEYACQKKMKSLALGIEKLSGRLSEIRAGGYAAPGGREGFAGEDADICRMAGDLEEIRQGLETAVEERTGSERMKVELLANVSHDIKTPLTSIISYIQLLRQEEELPEHVKDYVRILDEKSERLKTMVQDVFVVSKAVSGQLSVECKELDLGKLLQQTLADMDEMVLESPISLKAEIPAEPVTVWADGERMYRVFQNLIANALKYSLEGSRVYVTLKTDGKRAMASVKNTSSQELNQEIDFAERFTRGDKSRTDGGSGLGLSIAKSFTEACGGTFSLEIIADLFVVTVEFGVFHG